MVDYSTPRGGVPMLAEYSQIQNMTEQIPYFKTVKMMFI